MSDAEDGDGVTWDHPAPHSSECTCSWCEEETKRLSPEEAEELLHEAGQNINRVIVEYPNLTEELVKLLRFARKANAYTYFRVGKETESPSLKELSESLEWDGPLKEVLDADE